MLKTGNKSIGGINPSTNNLFKVESDNFATIILEALANLIGDLLVKYYDRDFSYLQQKLDDRSSFYQGLIRDIYTMEIPSYITFNIRTFFFNIVNGLKQSVKTAEHCAIVEVENTNLQEKADVLNDYKTAKEYVENMYKNLTRQIAVFEFQPITSIIPTINPKYIKYYEMYGRPVNGVYKSELMRNVELLLENDNNN